MCDLPGLGSNTQILWKILQNSYFHGILNLARGTGTKLVLQKAGVSGSPPEDSTFPVVAESCDPTGSISALSTYFKVLKRDHRAEKGPDQHQIPRALEC